MIQIGQGTPLVITVAPVGAEVTRDDNPNVPYTPDEIHQEVLRCYEAGARVCHLHIREADGEPSARLSLWREAVGRIRRSCDIVINVSTGGAITMTDEERLTGIELNPEMASLTTGTTNFGDGIFSNPLPMVRRFAEEMYRRGIQPELEIFDSGMVHNALVLVKQGVLKPPLHFNLMMGVPGAMAGTPENLFHVVRSLPEGASWSVGGIGRVQRQMLALAIVLGGHVRVGFEDNVKLTRSELAQSNADFVRWVSGVAGAYGRPLATVKEARDLLGVTARRADRAS